MVSKRQSHQEGNGRGHQVPIQESKRRHGDQKQAAVSGLRNVINGLSVNDLESYFEPLLRRVVREVLERKIQDHQFPRTTLNQTGTSAANPLQLRFVNKLPDTIFTLSNIIAEDEAPLQVVLFDVRTQSVVNDGPLSSIKIEICALNGEFGSNGSEDWTEAEFNASILRERDGKGSLLNGDRFITLKNGVGHIAKTMFTDNSSWIRSRKFRVGAKVVQPGANVKGARSEPFMVKDNRGEVYKKHYPPSLNDDVWRLEKISKDGKIHKQLSSHGIKTVRDLLQLYIIDPSSLHEKIGKIPKKSWQAITEHARACVVDDYNLYIYHTAEQRIGLLFNSIYMLVGVTFDGQSYCSPETLTPNQKNLVEIVKQHAYKNVSSLKSVDETSLNFLRPLARLQAGQAGAPDQGVQQFSFSTAQQDQLGLDEPFNSSSNIDEGVHINQACADPLSEFRELPQICYSEGDIFSGMRIEGNGCPFIESQWPASASAYSIENDHSQIQFTNCYSPATIWGQGNGFPLGFCDGAESSLYHFPHSSVDISSSRKPKAVWYKIRTALKWVTSVRRDAAARRMAKLFYCNY